MADWKNFDKLEAFGKLKAVKPVKLQEVMSGESGAKRVKTYSVPMAAGLNYNYAAKAVDEETIDALKALA